MKPINVFFIVTLSALFIGCDRSPYVPLPSLPVPAMLTMATPQDMREPRQLATASCNIETIGEGQVSTETRSIVLSQKDITISGWLLSEISHKSIANAKLRFVREDNPVGWQVGINTWKFRSDVLKTMGAIQTGNAGFVEYVDTSALTKGRYHLMLLFKDGDVNYVCDKGNVVISQ